MSPGSPAVVSVCLLEQYKGCVEEVSLPPGGGRDAG